MAIVMFPCFSMHFIQNIKKTVKTGGKEGLLSPHHAFNTW